jgi:hypothetical protein
MERRRYKLNMALKTMSMEDTLPLDGSSAKIATAVALLKRSKKQKQILISIKLLKMRGEIVTNARVGEMCKMHHPRCRALIFQLEEKGCVATISKYAESRSATEFYLTPLGEEMLRLAIA